MPVIVNYSHIASALGPEEAAVAVEEVTQEDPQEAAMFTVALSNALAKLNDAEIDADVFSAVDHSLASLLQSYIGERAAAAGKVDALTQEAKFDSKDIKGWVKQFFTWWRSIKKSVWIEAPEEPEVLPNHARIGILGDWGTGLYGAPHCANSVAGDARPFDVLIHLGDVYYSGMVGEVNERFLAFWPQKNVKISRALNSNHEMYTGGDGYFQITLRKFRQDASYFAMQNDQWLVIGLDSAYEEHDLAGQQAAWVQRMVGHAGDRKVILMSHHQLFSRGESQGTKLAAKLGPLLNDGRIFAWYWGHEHRCVLYDRHPLVKVYGRCVGHSGYPYFRDKFGDAQLASTIGDLRWMRVPPRAAVPGGLVLDGPNQYIDKKGHKYGPNGYMAIELGDGKIVENVHHADGTLLHNGSIG
jgi:hypothetical protein